ncbi:hypothetical protein [Thiomicrospira sp.]|uniref:hypothetical protein n=1 Tax=Thiomicrospira sp. TaxID=935 RepID=UPI002F956859
MFAELCRVVSPGQLKTAKSGKCFLQIEFSYSYFRFGKKHEQIVEATLWDKRAKALFPMLIVGSWVFITASDIHVSPHGGELSKLVCTIVDIKVVQKDL